MISNDNDIAYYLTKLLAITSMVIFIIICWRKLNTEENRQAFQEGVENAKAKQQEEEERKEIGENIYIWTDPETGVEYIIWEGYRKGGITPRIKPEN